MMLVVDPDAGAAPYEQLRRQLADAIADGELTGGAQLPTVRRLAADLGVAPNTVARTYQELERDGLIETRGRRGSFVADRVTMAERDRVAAQEAAARYVEAVRRLRVDDPTAVRLVQLALGEATGA